MSSCGRRSSGRHGHRRPRCRRSPRARSRRTRCDRQTRSIRRDESGSKKDRYHVLPRMKKTIGAHAPRNSIGARALSPESDDVAQASRNAMAGEIRSRRHRRRGIVTKHFPFLRPEHACKTRRSPAANATMRQSTQPQDRHRRGRRVGADFGEAVDEAGAWAGSCRAMAQGIGERATEGERGAAPLRGRASHPRDCPGQR